MVRGKRVSVTLSEEQARTIERLAKVNGQSQSRIVGELVEAVEPVLKRVASLCEFAAKAKGETATKLRGSMEEAQAELEPMLLKAMRLMGMEPTLPAPTGKARSAAKGPRRGAGGEAV